jgi:mannose-6-phosphate isomerase-like protein (cupin superfamily)
MKMSKEERPWGWFETIEENTGYKLKKIYVNSNQQFSLQYHNHREEHWIVVDGNGFITLDETISPAKVGDFFKINIKQVHRMKGGSNGILFYEVQMGDQCEETDIKRLQDDYGRTK